MREDGVDKKPTTTAYWPLLMEEFTPGSDDDKDPTFVMRSLAYVVRSSRTGSEGFVNELGRTVWSLNSQLPMAGVRTLQDVYDRSLARTSFALVMLIIAGAMALLLGITGIYGVISYSVAQRTREIGIRVALGAQARSVRRMFVTHGLVLAAVGVAIGIAAAVAMMRLMSTMLFEVSPGDPLTYGLVSLALIAAAVLASYIPAARATAVDPMHVLRAE
jgi:ABC-type antimicrobial peptide transport system permease subunit